MNKVLRSFCILLLAGMLAACDGADERVVTFDAGPLGAVEIGTGEAVQIRSLLSHTGAPSFGMPIRYGIELAVADVGDVRGRAIDLGEPIDSMCSGTGGKAAALQITADPQQIVGVIGTSCSGAAVTASPLISGAGLVMISPSNTSPQLTSDLAGKPGPGYHPGYFRTANNDLYEATVVAEFAYRSLGLRRMATIDDGDPYTRGLTVAFEHSFAELGGEVVAAPSIEKGETDMTDILADFAIVEDLDGIFFPLFSAEGSPFAEQAQDIAGLQEAALITSSALLTPAFLSTSQSLGLYFAGPEPLDGSNMNQVTGKSADEALAAYQAMHGAPETPYWMHAYDAATLLLSAIDAVAEEIAGKLYVDRAALREAMTKTEEFEGLLGTLSCDAFGYCGTGGVSIFHHTDTAVTDLADLEIVYP